MAIDLLPATPLLAAMGPWGFVVFFGFLVVLAGVGYWIIKSHAVSDIHVQNFVHRLEEGGLVGWVKLALLLSAIAFMIGMWFFDVTIPLISQSPNGFRGLAHEKAIEQAQIAREIRRGNGFSTKMVRPAALWQLEQHGREFPIDHTPDTYHAPLSPFINAIVFRVSDAVNGYLRSASVKMTVLSRFVYDEAMTKKGIVYAYDRIIAFTQVMFFLLAVLVSYFTAQRLFDHRLAVLGMGLLLLCQGFWDFAIAGLPQMLMLLLFSLGVHFLVRAVEARNEGHSPLKWIVGVGVAFSLLALAHGLTIWIYAGVIVFSLVYFRPQWKAASILLGIFLVFYGPWMVRNYKVCGSPVGIGWYSGMDGIRASESQIMRSMELPLQDVTPRTFRRKVEYSALDQMGKIYDFLGKVLPAPIFFIALMHSFKRKETADIRWAVFLCWLFAVAGMSTFGMPEKSGIHANDLHILFVPIMTFYGLAFLMVLWNRLEITTEFFRMLFLIGVYLISALPFISNFLEMISPPKSRVQWPPYIPPYIAILSEWTRPDEMIMSDMPWGVAWYADRKSLWLPMTIKDYINLNDYNQLKGEIVGMYLTPISGNASFVSDIKKGEYREWAPFITREVNLRDFPLHAATPLPLDNECIYFSDRDRWSNHED